MRESFLQSAKFVGRTSELIQLETALTATLTGNGSNWLIAGESGVGKSRLLSELRTRALVQGVTVLRGQGIDGSTLPYNLWRTILRGLVLAVDLSTLDKQVLKSIIPDIEMILAKTIPDAPELDSKSAEQRLLMTIRSVFQQYTQPTLVLLEDLQWVSEDLTILKELTSNIDNTHIMFVGTFRNDERPTLPDDLPTMNILTLNRLDNTHIAQLSASILGTAGHNPAIVDMLQRETEGNCFFIIEVVRVLAEETGRMADISRMTLPAKIITGGVQRIVERRLHKLPHPVLEWLKPIALYGRQLDLAIVDHLTIATHIDYGMQAIIQETADPDDIATRYRNWLLSLCTNVSILEISDNIWRFTHDKIREVFIASFTDHERRTLYQQIAEAIETIYPTDDTYAEMLCEFWGKANNAEKQAHYAFIAGENSRLGSRYNVARRYYKQALTLIETHPNWELANKQSIIHMHLGNIARIHGDLDFSLSAFDQAIHHAEYHGQAETLAHAKILKGITLSYAGGATEGLTLMKETFHEARKKTLWKPFAEGVAWYVVMHLSDPNVDVDAFIALLDEALAKAETFEDKRIKIRNQYTKGLYLAQYKQNYDTALNIYDETIALAESIGDYTEVAIGLGNKAVIMSQAGKDDDILPILQRSLKIARQIQHHEMTLGSMTNIAHWYKEHNEQQKMRKVLLELLNMLKKASMVKELLSDLVALFDEPTHQVTILSHFANVDIAPINATTDSQITLNSLKSHLPADVYTEALERGRTQSTNAIIDDLITHLST
ncbi:MAG: AAA family ATPase [Chloroflexota bacterium]